ncbi:MAG: amidohydrolase family protein, partial [Planctomycetota bacterium]
RELRPRLEEAQVVVPKDWPRFPDLGVLASIQPARLAPGLPGASSRRSQIERLLGSRRAGGVFAWRRVAPELGVLAFGSDAPAGSANPLHGIFAARRQTSDDAASDRSLTAGGLSGVDALAGYTSGPAFAAHQEGFRGRLLPGYDADFTVLDIDPVRVPLAELLEARVLQVFVGGRAVWSADKSGKVK